MSISTIMILSPASSASKQADSNIPRRGRGTLRVFASRRLIARRFSPTDSYAQAYNDPLGSELPPRLRIRAFMKMLELAKVQVMTKGPASVHYITEIFEGFRDHFDGRNPSFHRFAELELVMHRISLC